MSTGVSADGPGLTSRQAGSQPSDPFQLGGHVFGSRLIVGTGKYATYDLMGAALDRAGAECITVAIRRERLIDREGRSLLDAIDTSRYTLLPNTAGCFTADDAVRVARLGRELLAGLENPGADWVKLEVLADQRTLLPDPVATLDATERLVADGFRVPLLHDRRSGGCPSIEASGGDQRDASRQPDRIRAGNSQSECDSNLSGVSQRR